MTSEQFRGVWERMSGNKNSQTYSQIHRESEGGRTAYSTSLLDIWGEGWQHLIKQLEATQDSHVRIEGLEWIFGQAA